MNKLLIALMASVGIAGAAYAAPQANNPAASSKSAPQQQMSKANISDAQVKEFAKVHKEVSDVSAKYQAQLQSTSDPDAAAKISQKANKEMMDIVAKSDLSVEEYNQYAMLLQKDQTFQQKYRSVAK